MANQKTKNSIDKAISYDNTKVALDELAKKISIKDPKPNADAENNVIPFPMPDNAPLQEWYKTAKREDYLELLNRVYGEKFLQNKSIDELKEILEYTISTGGFGS
jgi:hypothetical protein